MYKYKKSSKLSVQYWKYQTIINLSNLVNFTVISDQILSLQKACCSLARYKYIFFVQKQYSNIFIIKM